jgi:hypothetical protein
MLEEKWPDKYNVVGHVPWGGRLYGKGQTIPLFRGRSRIYQGLWGSALFQSIYEPSENILLCLPLMPEWYLVMLVLAILSFAGLSWEPLFHLFPVFIFSLIISVVQAARSAGRAEFTIKGAGWLTKFKLYAVTAYLHLLQPLARLCGRVRYGLTPWKCRGIGRSYFPRKRVVSLWSEQWRSASEWLALVEGSLKEENVPYRDGGEYDNWDLEVRGGLLGAARLQLTIEDHGQGKQMLRFRIIPNFQIRRTWIIGVFMFLAVMAARDLAVGATFILGGVTIFLTLRMIKKCAYSKAAIMLALEKLDGYRC